MSRHIVVHLARVVPEAIRTGLCGAPQLVPDKWAVNLIPYDVWTLDLNDVNCLKCIVIATREQAACDA